MHQSRLDDFALPPSALPDRVDQVPVCVGVWVVVQGLRWRPAYGRRPAHAHGYAVVHRANSELGPICHVHRRREQASRRHRRPTPSPSSARLPLAPAERHPLHEQRVADPDLLQPDRGPAVPHVGRRLARADHPQSRPRDDGRRRRPAGGREGRRGSVLLAGRGVRRSRLAAAQDRVRGV